MILMSAAHVTRIRDDGFTLFDNVWKLPRSGLQEDMESACYEICGKNFCTQRTSLTTKEMQSH